MIPSQSNTQLMNVVVKQSFPDDSESFYAKLTDLLDSSGLTLIFNVRETSLDLYLFYLEVTRRGGFHQVGQQKKWGEVVCALKLEGSNTKLCAQVEKLYAHLLYKFEKLYFYRCPATSSTKVKRKHEDDLMVEKMSNDYSSQMTGVSSQEPQVLLQSPSNNKEMKKRGQSGYQIFLKQECARLKAYSQEIDGTKILRMAVDAWKKLSDIEKQPYLEESKKIRGKNKAAMIIENKQKSTHEDLKKDEKWPSMYSGDYYVSSQPLANYSFVNNAAGLKMTEKPSKDPLFLVGFDAYHSSK
ncbi:putative high mobility group B protein 11 [Cicer arietinum]|uniref:High mobility group B protein 11 isoform X2 n=1 Tax=Cicer arietinum TaxID=3827 RepID=A0A1S3E2F0_CICAR|nr:putative high mobility group B protein 11 isoform X2 [Cicer arietinum]